MGKVMAKRNIDMLEERSLRAAEDGDVSFDGATPRRPQLPMTVRSTPRGHAEATDHIAAISGHFERILRDLGEDETRPGLLRTPTRAATALAFLTSGYAQTVDDVLGDALFEENVDQMVLVRDIEFCSLCEHHLLPFYGKCDVAYIPNGRIVGLSKIARVVDLFARRLQVQERLASQIAQALDSAIRPKGVGVIIRAKHLCMMIRGVQKQHSETTTSEMLGLFRDRAATRAEFLELARGNG
jgi:GTP cyclohydrolase I